MDAEASRSPRVGISLTSEAQEKLQSLAEQLIADAVKTCEDTTTKHAAEVIIENEQLREKMKTLEEANRKLRERLKLPPID